MATPTASAPAGTSTVTDRIKDIRREAGATAKSWLGRLPSPVSLPGTLNPV